MSQTGPASTDPQGRRRFPRVAGPFEGFRIGKMIRTPVVIHDLGLGGCLIRAEHDQPAGRQFQLEIQLPGEEPIQVQAESLYSREFYGYAVRFLDLPDGDRQRLERAIEQLLRAAPEA